MKYLRVFYLIQQSILVVLSGSSDSHFFQVDDQTEETVIGPVSEMLNIKSTPSSCMLSQLQEIILINHTICITKNTARPVSEMLKIKRYSVNSLVYTEALTRPSSPSRHCTHGIHFNPPGDIPEQLAAYSAHSLSTALFMLGTHFAAG